MGRKRSPLQGKKINPTYYVFCEGETEVEYINLLRNEFRIPIKIVSKDANSSISKDSIKNYKNGKFTHKKDKDFLLYDGDKPEVVEELKKIDEATLLISYPCIELWVLLHIQEQNGYISTNNCISKLKSKLGYDKGVLEISFVRF